MSVPSVGRIGAHCDEAGCGQLDFLPFNCPYCHRTYCLEHRDTNHHKCTVDRTKQNVMPTCPVCQQIIHVLATDSVDAKVNAHILSGCKNYLFREVEQEIKAKQSITLRCDFIDGCNNREGYSTIVCKKCKKQYCLSHRFPEQHKCKQVIASPGSRSSNNNVSNDKHKTGKALLEKLRLEREEREANKKKNSASALLRESAAARKPPTSTETTPTATATTTASNTTTTLQQIRAAMNSVGSYLTSFSAVTGATGTPSTPTPISPEAISSSNNNNLSPPFTLPSSPSSPSLSPETVSSPSPSSPFPGRSSPSPPPTYTFPSYRPVKPSSAAVGNKSIDDDNRWYWRVDLSALKKKRLPVLVFVNKNWTIGRVIDELAELCEIENDNHTIKDAFNNNSRPKGKLILCCPRTSTMPLPYEIPLRLLDPAVRNGDTVALIRQKERENNKEENKEIENS